MTDRTDPPEDPNGGQNAPLFSLVSGEGDGFMLGLAAGDTAGGAWKLGYSSITEQATVVAYQLIERRSIEPGPLVEAMREMDGSQGVEPVFRSESRAFRAWLDRAAAAGPGPTEEPDVENLVRTAPVGAAFRRDVDAVVSEAISVSRIFSTDTASIAAGVLGASAVAAAAFGQSGRDLVVGVSEAVVGAAAQISDEATGSGRLDSIERELADAIERVGAVAGEEVDPGTTEDPLSLAIAGLVLSAPMREKAHTAVEEAARWGGSILGSFVGAIIGARVGIRAWPWPFANDTWFAEIGRRVVRGPDEIRDLPIPYAVEQHLMSGTPRGFH